MPKYNHNEHYAELLLRQVPAGCQNALDIGCGDGAFAHRLALSSNLAEATQRGTYMVSKQENRAIDLSPIEISI